MYTADNAHFIQSVVRIFRELSLRELLSLPIDLDNQGNRIRNAV